jgi:hypothetical protein
LGALGTRPSKSQCDHALDVTCRVLLSVGSTLARTAEQPAGDAITTTNTAATIEPAATLAAR